MSQTLKTKWNVKLLQDWIAPDAPICYGILMPGPDSSDGVPVVKVKDYFSGGLTDTRQLLKTSPEIDRQYSRSRLRSGDVLLSIRGTTGAVAVVPESLDGANITQDTARLRVRRELNREFLVQALQTQFVQSQIQLHTVGQAVKGINISEVRRLQIPTPPEPVQKYMSDLLSNWDHAFEQSDVLAASGLQRTHGLVQRLLSGKTRLPRFCEAWQWLPAGNIFENHAQRNNSVGTLLSVTQDQGVVPRDSLEGKVTMPSGDLSSFKLVEPGQFVISLRSFQGGLEHSDYTGLVSPAYTVLRTKLPISSRFYKHYFKSAEFIKRLAVAVIGIRDGKQVSYDDFCTVRIPYPNLDEQEAVADVLDAAKKTVDLTTRERDLLKRQKQALMQKLLTGEIRVPLNQEV